MFDQRILIIRDDVLFDVPTMQAGFQKLVDEREKEIVRTVGGPDALERLDFWKKNIVPTFALAWSGDLNIQYFLDLTAFLQIDGYENFSINEIKQKIANKVFMRPYDTMNMEYENTCLSAWGNVREESLKLVSTDAIDFLSKFYEHCESYCRSNRGAEKVIYVMLSSDDWPVKTILNAIQGYGGGLASAGTTAEINTTNDPENNISPQTSPSVVLSEIRHYSGDDNGEPEPKNILYITRATPVASWQEAGIDQIVFAPTEPPSRPVNSGGRTFAAHNFSELEELIIGGTPSKGLELISFESSLLKKMRRFDA